MPTMGDGVGAQRIGGQSGVQRLKIPARAACKAAYPGPIAAWPPKALRSTPRTRTDRGTGNVNSVRHAAFKAGAALLYATAITRAAALFPGSSVVEQPAVNRLVAGSNPARGAK